MSLQDEYRKTILEKIIKGLLASGNTPTINQIEDAYNTYIKDHALDEPQFDNSTYSVEAKASSSASKYNNTNSTIREDLMALYRNSLVLGNSGMQLFDRTRSEMQRLESQLDRLSDRIGNLLIVTKDTEGYFNFVSDVFTDTDKIDIPNSSILVDLSRGQVTLGTSTTGASRLFLNNIKSENIVFTVLTRQNLQSVIQAENGEVRNAVIDSDAFWQHRVYMSKAAPVSAELRIKLDDVPRKISRILFRLHTASTTSATQITPLISLDGINYSQLPTDSFSISTLDKATFTFPELEATHIKFILTKSGFDNIDNLNYVYEFGADDIVFFNESFASNETSQLISKPLSVLAQDGSVATFSKSSLEVCEAIPTKTTIDYFVAATDDNTIAVANLNWIPIDPLNRLNPVNPLVIDFTDLTKVELGNVTTSGNWVKASYDPNGGSLLTNPAATFKVMSMSGATEVITPVTTSGIRYVLPTNNDRILDHQIEATVDIQEDRTIVLRNLGLQGNKDKVRGIQSGWGFLEPYYSCVVEVLNPLGIDINFGDKGIIIDGVQQKGTLHLDPGFHLVKTHKNNWIDIADMPANAHTIVGLQSVDSLYPFNHKLLIEGLDYPEDFIGEQIYKGVDTFAELKMSFVSPFDMLRSVSPSDYSRFSVDLDAKDGAREPSRVIIVKTDSTNPDFKNERFVIRLKVNTSSLSFKYIWLRADLETQDEGVAPIIDSYRIKLGR